MSKLTVREHVKKFATLLKGKNVVLADDAKVRSAAATLEGTSELLNESPDDMQVPVHLTVGELRSFVAYMRALDNVARETLAMEKRCSVAELGERQARSERDEVYARLKIAEEHLKSDERQKVEEAATDGAQAGKPRKRANRARLILRRAARTKAAARL